MKLACSFRLSSSYLHKALKPSIRLLPTRPSHLLPKLSLTILRPISSTRMSPIDAEHYLADKKCPVSRLEIKKHFEALTDTEKKYAHFISRASWEGARIIITQANHAGEDIYDFIISIFKGPDNKLTDIDELKSKSGVSDEEFNDFIEYSAQFLGNLSNYKSFGDQKFIPRISANSVRAIAKVAHNSAHSITLLDRIEAELYSLEHTHLGFPEDGQLSGYYTQDITKAEIAAVQAYIEQINISPLNTRLFKKSPSSLYLKVASADSRSSTEHKLPSGETLTIEYGDFSPQMTKIADNIAAAIPFAANEHQRLMLEAYERSFRTGSIDDHKESQRQWIKDVGPSVESNIGFIESYRDPAGTRAEWEGFVAMVNKEQTEKFGKLVDAAPSFLALLPWSKEFEKDKFQRPDFTSLEVLSFACSGVPAGINIPNYDDIRMTLGFKNVSLGNVLNAASPDEKITFVTAEDMPLYKKLRGNAFEVQVGIHELLGHGSGKLLSENTDGTFNFDRTSTINPLTGKLVETWYKPGETWGSVFGSIAASYEECRAESVAMHLAGNKDVLRIFGHTEDSHEEGTADDILYVCFLSMCRAGLVGLEVYDPKSRKWGQAHMQARFAIMKVLLDAGQGLVRIEHDREADKAYIHLDRSKIASVGEPAISTFLQKLNIYKAVADRQGGTAFYDEATRVDDDWLELRGVVLRNKVARKQLVQANTHLSGDDVELREYEPSTRGLIQSYVERDL